MALAYADRVLETTTTTGVGTVDLGGAKSGGYQTFVAGIGGGNTCHYCIVDKTNNAWEVGLGTVTDAATDTLSRTTILASSNAGAAVNFAAGTKDVFCVVPAMTSGTTQFTMAGDLDMVGNTILFDDAKGLKSDTGGLFQTGPGGATWGGYAATNAAGGLIAGKDDLTQIVVLSAGDGLGGWTSYWMNNAMSARLVEIDHTNDGFDFTGATFDVTASGAGAIAYTGNLDLTAANIDFAASNLLIDNGKGLTSDAGGQFKTGTGGKTWQAWAGANDAAGFVAAGNAGETYVLLASGDGAGGWTSFFYDSLLTTRLLEIDHINDTVTFGSDIYGDFSNATVNDRIGFRTSTANGGTFVTTRPNGTAVQSGFTAIDAATQTNATGISMYTEGVSGIIQTQKWGTGISKPMSFRPDGFEALNLGIDLSATFSGDILVTEASSGVTASSFADNLIVEGSSGHTGISIFTAGTSSSNLFFGYPTEPAAGRIQYDPSIDWFNIQSLGQLNLSAGEVHRFAIETDGTLHAITANYEALITDDDDIPNRKWVTDQGYITSAGAGISNVVEDTTPEAGGDFDFQQFDITGDFDSATVSNRVMFKTTTLNTPTSVFAKPNGTGGQSGIGGFADSDVDNSPYVTIYCNATGAFVSSSRTGTGTTQPLSLAVEGSTALTVPLSGAIDFFRDIDLNGNNITGDFDNATISNRSFFQTTGTNQPTSVFAIPNGTSNQSGFGCFGDTDADNAPYVLMLHDGAVGNVGVATTGTGAATPLTFSVAGIEVFRLPVGAGSLQLSNAANLDLVGNDLVGDFSNATVASRSAFVTSTLNANTDLTVTPNGTATGAFVTIYNDSDPTNAEYLTLAATATTTILASNALGTGTPVPMELRIGADTYVEIGAASGIASAPATVVYNSLEVNSAGPSFILYENDQAVNQKAWGLAVTGGEMFIQARTDVGGGGGNLFKFTRSAEQAQTFEAQNSAVTWLTIDNVNKKLELAASTEITGDFSNATKANRTAFVTTATNLYTILTAKPSGTGSGSYLQLFEDNDVDNTSGVTLGSTATKNYLRAEAFGTGSLLPLQFEIGGTTVATFPVTGAIEFSRDVRIDTTGASALFIDTATGQASTSLQFQKDGVTRGLAYFNLSDSTYRFQALDSAGSFSQSQLLLTDTIQFETGGTGAANSVIALELDENQDATFYGNIAGDFSDANVANRTQIVTNVTNGKTGIPILPNGTGDGGAITFYEDSTTTNSPFFTFGNSSTEAYLISGRLGTGTFRPMAFYTNEVKRLEIETDGTLNVAATTNYESLVTADDDIPNRKWVIDQGYGTGTGNVSNSGTPVNDQLAVWTNSTTVEGQPELTYSAGSLKVGNTAAGEIRSGSGQNLTIAGGTGAAQLSISGPFNGAGNGGSTTVGGGTGSGTGGPLYLNGGSSTVGTTGGFVRVTPGAGSSTAGYFEFNPPGSGDRTPVSVRFKETGTNGSNYVALEAPASITTNRTWTLPQDNPSTASGKFLTTDSSGILSFAAAGMWELITTWTPTAVSSKDFTWDETVYSNILLVGEGIVPGTDNASLYLRFGHTNGGTVYGGSGDYRFVRHVNAENGTWNPDSSIQLQNAIHLTSQGIGSATAEGGSFTIELQGGSSLVNHPSAHWEIAYDTNLNNPNWTRGSALCIDDTADDNKIDTLRLLWSTGSFSAVGTVYCYGLKRT